MATWDPAQYGRFADHRSRPFFELVSRIDADAPARVVDLGCGSGELTATLAERWPSAEVVGVDNSPAMLEDAAAYAGERLHFELGDLAAYRPDGADVVVSNAAYQWLDGHPAILADIAAGLPAGGWFAIQVPGNFGAPSHVAIRELAAEPSWRASLDGLTLRKDATLDPAGYGEIFAAAGLLIDCWETTYDQVLPGTDPVLEWVKGTALRPVLTHLESTGQADRIPDFLAELGGRLRELYPARPYGTVFPFRRVFAVGHRPA